MRYLVQYMTMFCDLLLVAAGGYGVYLVFTVPNILLKFIIVGLLLGSYSTFKKQDGFIAWTKEGRANFNREWAKMRRVR
jgi:hypothetical protein